MDVIVQFKILRIVGAPSIKAVNESISRNNPDIEIDEIYEEKEADK